MAGIRGGTTHGESDETGYQAAQDVTTGYDLHATILHLVGIDHERLTVRDALLFGTFSGGVALRHRPATGCVPSVNGLREPLLRKRTVRRRSKQKTKSGQAIFERELCGLQTTARNEEKTFCGFLCPDAARAAIRDTLMETGISEKTRPPGQPGCGLGG